VAKGKYNYEATVKNASDYERAGSRRAPVKRVLRKLVREAVYQSHLAGLIAPREQVTDRADRIAEELVP
jgi:hypothetical protein